MSKDPAFLFYYQDFLVGTTFMTLEERGAYITLLCYLADKGKITLTEILKIIPEHIWSAICCKFKKDGDYYFNGRLQEEIEKRKKFTESRRKNLHKESHMDDHMKAHMENENININKDELDKLNKEYGIEVTKKAIQYLSDYKTEKNYKTKSDYLTLKRWVFDAVKEKELKNGTNTGFKANSYRGNNNDRKLTPGAEEELERIAESLRAKQ
jgi:uncharacterized protein YdaU (DUF1376 family)